MLERLARAYVKHCGDVPACLREAIPTFADKTDRYLISHFNSLYNDQPAFWEVVDEFREAVKKEVAIGAADVIANLAAQVNADYTVFSKVIVRPCPHCWQHLADDATPPRIPFLGCRACAGDGVKSVDITPTAQLTPEQRKLWRGAEQTKNGIKIKTADPDKATELLGRAFGLFSSNLQIAATLVPALPDLPIDQVEASRMYAEWVKQGESES